MINMGSAESSVCPYFDEKEWNMTRQIKKQHKKGTYDVRMAVRKSTWQYHLLILPGLLFVLVYTIIPFFGNIIAFQDYKPILGFLKSDWVGLKHFRRMFALHESTRVIRNSLIIAVSKIVCSLATSLFFAILLNEIRNGKFTKIVQTLCFFPHFLSWVVLATVFKSIFDVNGIINKALMEIGIIEEAIMFLGSNDWFRPVLVATDVWKGFGYDAIIFIAALTGINPELYEAADIDGAGRLQKIWHITMPGVKATLIMVATLKIGSILNAGFDQVFNLYNSIVYETADIIDTYVYRMSFENAQFSYATAVGVFKSVVSFLLIIVAQKLAAKYSDYRIF